MAATVLVREVLRRASFLLLDEAPQFARFSERNMVDALNDAHAAIAKYLPLACSRLDSIALAPGTRQSIDTIDAANVKPADGSIPTGPIYGKTLLEVVRNMGATGTAPGAAIRPVSRKLLDLNDASWHTKTAAAISEFTYNPESPHVFYVNPGVPATGLWVEIAYTAQPARIPNTGTPGAELYKADGSGAGANTVISVDDEYVDDLTSYVAARLNAAELEWADAAKASAFASLFTQSLNAKVAAMSGANPNLSRLPFSAMPLGAAK